MCALHLVGLVDVVGAWARRVARVSSCGSVVLPHLGAGWLATSNSAIASSLVTLLASPTALSALSLVTAFAHAAAALRVSKAASVFAAVSHTLLYGWSQANHYQHEYMYILLLALDALAALGTASDAEHAAVRRRVWAGQLSIVYGWTAVAKVDSRWWSGQTLAAVLRAGPDSTTFGKTTTALLARTVLLGEIVACLAVASLALRSNTSARLRACLALGLAGAHVGLKLFNFSIGSFVEIVLLLLIVVTVSPDQPLPGPTEAAIASVGRYVQKVPRVVAALIVAGTVALTARAAPALPDELAGSLARVAGTVDATRRPAVGSTGRLALACVTVALVVAHLSSPSLAAAHAVAVGDDAASRGLSDLAATAYDEAVAADPTRAQSWVALAVTTRRATGEPLALARLDDALALVSPDDHWQLHFARVSVAVDGGSPSATVCAAVADFLSVPKTTLSCSGGEECARLRNFRASAIQGVTRVREQHGC